MTCLVTLWLTRKIFLDTLLLFQCYKLVCNPVQHNLSSAPPPPQLRVLRDPEHDEVSSETERRAGARKRVLHPYL